MRVAGRPNLVLVAHGDHLLQEVVDPLPEDLGRYRPRPGQRRLLPASLRLQVL